MKKSFLFINKSGDFLGIQQRIQDEGHQCYAWYHPDVVKGKGKTGKGLIEIVDDFADVLKDYHSHKEDLIILIDDNSWGDWCDLQRLEGWYCVGSSHYGDDIEHERTEGSDLAKRLGLKIPTTTEFKDFNSGREFIKGVRVKMPEARFVFKANGADLAGSSKTYVSKSLDDLEWFMNWVEKDCGVKGYSCDSFILQLLVDGLEADYACWYNGEKFAPVVGVTWEQKKLHDLGAAQGCYGQILTFIPAKDSTFFTEHFSKLLPYLKGSGPNEWAINNIISHRDHKPYFLEFTPRFGWDSTFGELALLQDAGRPLGEFFTMIALGLPFPKSYFPIGKYSASARLFSESSGTSGEVVKGKPVSWNKEIEDNIWWYSLMKHEDDRYEITDNPIGVMTAVADSPAEAMAKLYALLTPASMNLITPDLFYSEHIGEGVAESERTLKEWGWLPK